MKNLQKYKLRGVMFRLFFLMVVLSLSNRTFAQHTTPNWWSKDFIIGMFMDPPQRTGIKGWSADSLWNAVSAAKINLATGIQRSHGYECDAISPMQHAQIRGIRYLYFDSRLLDNVENSTLKLDTLLNNNNIYYSGVYVKDEPKEEQFESVNQILQTFKTDSCHLFFVNLFPSYYKTNWSEYENYVRLFVNDSVPMRVICFDNYNPHNDFTIKSDASKYYSNLAFLRKVSGDKPLWIYVLTTEAKLNDSSEEWQKAYLRLSTFAPLAYGCKGILYYSFDCSDNGLIYRDFNYRSHSGWETFLYYSPPSEAHEVFFGKMSSTTNGMADLAIKSDVNGGTWYVKLAEDTTTAWNYVFHDFGQANYTQSFIADWDNNYSYEFMALVHDGRLLVSYPLGGWRYRIPLQDFPLEKASLINRNLVAAGCFNNNAYPDFCVAWPKEGTGYIIRTYWDYNESQNEFCEYTDAFLENLLGLSVDGNILWVINQNGAVDVNDIYLSQNQNSTKVKDLLEIKNEQSFWMEDSNRVCIQNSSGLISEYNLLDNNPHVNVTHSTSQLRLQAVYNHATTSYDMYGIPKKELFGFPALIDKNHQTTNRYDMVKENYIYIHEVLAPIVMNSKWLGAWHSTIPPQEEIAWTSTIDENTPLVKSLDDKMLVGIFETNETLRHLFVVNKNEALRDTCNLILRGNFENTVAMKPRITTGNTNFTTVFRPDSLDTVLKWENMKGGECVVVSIHGHRLFTKRKIYEDFDGDVCPDISYVQIDSIYHHARLKSRLSSEQFLIERELASFPYELNDEGKFSVWNLSARYGEDKLTDVAIFDGAIGVLYIKHRTMDSLCVDTTHFYLPISSGYVPFYGDLNGDGAMDFSYRTDVDENLRVHLSRNGALDALPFLFNLYGHSHSTIPIRGDWDGNGLEDIALYRSDHMLLIDYAFDDNHLGLGFWNVKDTLDINLKPKNLDEIQPFCRDWDGDGWGDLGLCCTISNKFCVDLGYNGFGVWDILLNLPLRDNELLFQVVCEDWNQDGMDDIIFIYKNEEGISSISVDFSSNGLGSVDEHIEL